MVQTDQISEEEKRRRRQEIYGLSPLVPTPPPATPDADTIRRERYKLSPLEPPPIQQPQPQQVTDQPIPTGLPLDTRPTDPEGPNIFGAILGGLKKAGQALTGPPPVNIPFVTPGLQRGFREGVKPLQALDEIFLQNLLRGFEPLGGPKQPEIPLSLNPRDVIERLAEANISRPIVEEILGGLGNPAFYGARASRLVPRPGTGGTSAPFRPRTQIALPPGATRPSQQLALPPAAGRTVEGAIIAPGRVVTPQRTPVIAPEPSLIIVTSAKPGGERLIFTGVRALRRAVEELGQRADVQILPGNAGATEVERATQLVSRAPPLGTQTTIPIERRTLGGIVVPRAAQRQLPRGLDPDDLDALRSALREREAKIRKIIPGPRPNSPQNQRLRALEAQAASLRQAITDLQGPILPPTLDIPGVIRREPITRVIPPTTQNVLGPRVIRSAEEGGVLPGIQRAEVRRPSDIPIEASTPEEVARLRAEVRASRARHINAGTSEVPPKPVTGQPQKPVTTQMPEASARFLEQVHAGRISGERLDQAALRFHSAAIREGEIEAQTLARAGGKKFLDLGLGRMFRGSWVPNPDDISVLDNLYEVIHSPREIGQVIVPERFRGILDELQGLTDWEQSFRLDFDPNMAMKDNYFYRGWKPPESAFVERGGRLVQNPAFRKPRVDSTYREMRKLGFEPLFWNPYEQWRVSRLQGIKYHQQMQLVDALKSFGDEMIEPLERNQPLREGWRVPQVGPAFEGKPFTSVEGTQGWGRRWAVRDEIANGLENMYGLKPNVGKVHVGGKSIDLLKVADWLTFIPKRAKLLVSFFQQMDFLRRAGVGSFHGMVNALRTGHPIEAVIHLAKYPPTAAEMLIANFSPSWRQKLRLQLRDTTPIIPSRPGITMRSISRSGLSVQDPTILPNNIDEIARQVAQESTPAKALKFLPRVLGGIERASRNGLFEGIYPAAILNDVRHNIVPVLARTYPQMTDAQLSSAAAQLANIRFSTIPATQSVVQNQFVREVLRRLFFSLGESEGLLRQAAGAVRPGAQFRSFWIEHWAGAYLFLIATANAIHWASTGKVLPFDRYTPISETDFGPLPFGYNPKFAAPTIPIGGKGGLEVRLDLVDQLDTAFRILDPKGFIGSRVNVPIRALETQSNAKDFYRQPIDEVGPGGVFSRTTALAQDLFSPIGVGTGGLSVLAEQVPSTRPFIISGERGLGTRGQAVQASGMNLRTQGFDEILSREIRRFEEMTDGAQNYRRGKFRDAIFDEGMTVAQAIQVVRLIKSSPETFKDKRQSLR